ncbi:proprotein convertase P-domain-containing protein [Herbihabitans rhizosphaerae]|uniref:Proprotein convertase P-domain-containing protein n=1 Tax=Herbihabitans rhizosphaerae TaxID=1872711 RepID=A0A4Q7KXD2_9PSEU|nr:S8 family serine peptidase [Herbihabitans rhizosphaerae]RZS41384.1 proprotein convertase P-domain-containing protein [Herbihabitans rhizosphaerae]
MSRRLSVRRAAIAVAVGTGLAIAGPAVTATAAPPSADFTGLRSYLVISAPNDTAAAKKGVTDNNGTVYTSYDAIGVVVAHSASATFAADVRKVAGVQQVGATRTSDLPSQVNNPPIPPSPTQNPSNVAETVRWDMAQIGADKAWAVNPGSASVTVGVLDTGVDDKHADLAANFDASKSGSCAYGKLDIREGSWRDTGTHGTHVAGTIAATKNNKGMVGVATGVKIASVRVAENPSGLFFAENTVCAFVFAGDKGFKVTNNSYYTDPWLFNCPSDPDQAAIVEGVKRATAYAEGKGVLHVAAAGNENYDLANKTTDTTSPNDSTPVSRQITNDCVDVPAELPGVVTVAAVGDQDRKSGYSNFGADKIDIAAPGGDSAQDTGVYSTVPGGGYGNKNGTSMASPHVAGVAALLASTNPDATPAQLAEKLAVQANDLACPSGDSRCTGTAARNSFYGEGQADALEAVSGTTPPPSKFFESTDNVNIPDAGATVTSSLGVTGITGSAPATLKVGVDIKHTYRGDLVIDLVAPDGTAYRLKNASSGDSVDNVITTYTVNASAETAAGTWKLRVQDVYRADTGYVDAWNLSF